VAHKSEIIGPNLFT